MPKEAVINSHCPHCNREISTKVTLPDQETPPNTRCKALKSTGTMFIYRINTDMIRDHLTEKVREIVPTAKLDLAPRYTERKNRQIGDGHAYAFLNIALSSDVVAGTNDWFGSIGTDTGSVRLVPDMFENFVNRFHYDPKTIQSILKNYRHMERLEDSFGMKESYLMEMKKFSVPQRVGTEENKSWIFFAAAPEKIIEDMLTDPDTNTVKGKWFIEDVRCLSKELVEYLVYLNPNDVELHEDYHVRQILMGEEKIKK